MLSVKAQGTTEYLILLAVVLIVALVSVALLGFFPGMASDAQITQSKVYWQSATPISLIETAAPYNSGWSDRSWPYLRIRNTGAYPIRLTKILGAGQSITNVYGCVAGGQLNISDLYYLAPGEEKFFRSNVGGYSSCIHFSFSAIGTGTGTNNLASYSSGCETATGTLIVNNFGFEYIQYMDGSQLTKQQIGSKPLIIKCTG